MKNALVDTHRKQQSRSHYSFPTSSVSDSLSVYATCPWYNTMIYDMIVQRGPDHGRPPRHTRTRGNFPSLGTGHRSGRDRCFLIFDLDLIDGLYNLPA
jgi:hypothetical protein